MIFECTDYDSHTRKFTEYYQDEKDTDKLLWEKVEPKKSELSGRVFVVKSFVADTDEVQDIVSGERYEVNIVRNADGLPYEPVKATAAVDMWALGTILYFMLTGQRLFDVDIDYDLKDGKSMRELHDRTVKGSNNKLDKVKDKKMKKLLMMLLSEDPEKRGSAISVKAFANEDSPDLVEDINKLMDMNTEKIMTSVFEATCVNIPTSFIILPYKIHRKEMTTKDMIMFGKEVVEELIGFQKNMTISDSFVQKMTQKFSHNNYYLYLIDEYDHSTIDKTEGPYPIEIKQPQKEVLKVMSTFLTTMKVYNDAAKFAKLFFPLVPEAPKEFTDYIEKNFTPQNVPSLNLNKGDVQKLGRGKELQDFETFLKEHDPNRNFCGLIRVHNPENGKGMWVSKKSLEKMEKVKHGEYVEDSVDTEYREKLRENAKVLEEKTKEIERLKKELQEFEQKAKAFDDQKYENDILNDKLDQVKDSKQRKLFGCF